MKDWYCISEYLRFTFQTYSICYINESFVSSSRRVKGTILYSWSGVLVQSVV